MAGLPIQQVPASLHFIYPQITLVFTQNNIEYCLLANNVQEYLYKFKAKIIDILKR